ncbi:hypothetical protein AB1N83_004800 [Pleurotus pulmonarius]
MFCHPICPWLDQYHIFGVYHNFGFLEEQSKYGIRYSTRLRTIKLRGPRLQPFPRFSSLYRKGCNNAWQGLDPDRIRNNSAEEWSRSQYNTDWGKEVYICIDTQDRMIIVMGEMDLRRRSTLTPVYRKKSKSTVTQVCAVLLALRIFREVTRIPAISHAPQHHLVNPRRSSST